MPISDIYGHTHSEKAWEPLKVHLQEVSALAGDFASAFDAADWGRLAGYWHDLGKYSEEFQNYLKEVSEHDCHRAELRGSVDHSSAGAQWSIEKHKQLGMLLSHIIAGHHSGLLDYHAAGAACLEKRLKKVVNGWREHADPQLLELPMPPPPKLPQKSLTNNMLSFRLAFWVRMLFSALVDADFLATESYMRPEQTELRSGKQVGLSQMRHVLDSHIKTIQSTSMDTKINCNRNEILQQCLTAAKLPPGFFELCAYWRR